ncbi:MAG: histidine kinase dimerization/phosphoacceptor domain-containing protein [Caldilineaceae bacterium]
MPRQPHFWGQTESEQRQLWRTAAVLLGLIAAQAAGFALAAQDAPLGVTRFSLAVAALLATPVLLVAVARPGIDTRLAAVLAVLLAGMVVVPFQFGMLDSAPPGQFLHTLPFFVLLRLFDGVLVILVGYHLTTRFPVRPPQLQATMPSDRRVFVIYIGTAAALVTLVLAPAGVLRIGLVAMLFVWMWGLLIQAHWHLLQVARLTDPPHQRAAQQARLLLLGFVAAEAPIVVRIVGVGMGYPNAVAYEWLLAGQVALIVAVIYAVLRHDLFDIDAGVRRALAYTGVTAVLLSLFLALTYLSTNVIARYLPRFQTAAVLTTMLVAALAFRPLYSALQRFTDRLFYPERLRFRGEIAQARQELQQVMDAAQVQTLLTHDLPPRLDLSWATLTLAPAHDVRCATIGSWKCGTHGSSWVNIVIGRYWVGPRRRSGLAFDRAEQDLLLGIAEQAAWPWPTPTPYRRSTISTAVSNCKWLHEPNKCPISQRQLAVLEKDKRQLAHDLHDSVNQTLFSISLGTRALRKLVRRSPT